MSSSTSALELGVKRGFSVYPRAYYFARAKLGKNAKFDSPRRDTDRGEHLVDASWTSYPDDRTAWVAELRAGQRRGRRIELACESEWATSRYGRTLPPDFHVAALLDDFSKLTELRARLKVMIFSFLSEDGATFPEIVEILKAAAAPLAADESYVFFGWPWNAHWPDRTSLLRSEVVVSTLLGAVA